MCCPSTEVIKSYSNHFLAIGELEKDKLCDTYKGGYRPMSKRFIKPPYSKPRATPIDSGWCRQPTASALSNKADKSRSNQFLSTGSCFKIRYPSYCLMPIFPSLPSCLTGGLFIFVHAGLRCMPLGHVHRTRSDGWTVPRCPRARGYRQGTLISVTYDIMGEVRHYLKGTSLSKRYSIVGKVRYYR